MKRNHKRLISANFLGFNIANDDGHRWINFDKESSYNAENLYEASQENKVWLVTSKVYGGVEEALDVIDYLLKKLNRDSLLEYFDKYVSEEFDVKNVDKSNIKSRVGKI